MSQQVHTGRFLSGDPCMMFHHQVPGATYLRNPHVWARMWPTLLESHCNVRVVSLESRDVANKAEIPSLFELESLKEIHSIHTKGVLASGIRRFKKLERGVQM